MEFPNGVLTAVNGLLGVTPHPFNFRLGRVLHLISSMLVRLHKASNLFLVSAFGIVELLE